MNPFIIKGYRSPMYYCNRKQEVSRINGIIDNRRNAVIYGRRRLGKTALIQHVFHQRPKKELNLLINLMPTNNVTDLIETTAAAIIGTVNEKSGFGTKVWSKIKSLNPVISYNELSGQPSVSFQYRNEQQSFKTLGQLIDLLAEHENGITIAFDEFQQILNYPEKNMEGRLRTIMEAHSDIPFLFSGSDQHLIGEMFTQQNRPFYSSSDFFKLNVIEVSAYKSFIARHFKRGGMEIEDILIDEILEWSGQITELVQIICNRLYQLLKKNVSQADLNQTLIQLMAERDDVYFMLRRSLTPLQWKLLTAIAKEGRVHQLYGKSFLSTHGFVNASSIRRAAESLKKALFFYHGIEENESWLELHDMLFARWLVWRQG